MIIPNEQDQNIWNCQSGIEIVPMSYTLKSPEMHSSLYLTINLLFIEMKSPLSHISPYAYQIRKTK